ncbi:DUF2770 domain-containing protein [Salmonella enterica subsp. enterica serovar Enteritidis]|nr:DUF2770 domain-containing protein [Salmonella enterica subsp. enterica serovar Enteritidis]
MGSCAAPSAKGDDKFITTDYLQQCLREHFMLYVILWSLLAVMDIVYLLFF